MTITKRIQVPYAPHKAQAPFHESSAKFRAFITGVGAGKTVAGANELLKMAIQYPDTYAVMAPNSKILNNATLPELYRFGRELILYERKSKNLIVLINGARIIYLTADNQRHVERLRGMTLGGFWADEACLFLMDVWFILIGRLRGQTGCRRGILTSTPKGLDWVYWTFVKKVDPRKRRAWPNPTDYEWFGGTSMDNPYLPEDFIQTLKNTYTGLFAQQEIMGEFVGFEGQVYQNFTHAKHIIKGAKRIVQDGQVGIEWPEGRVVFKEFAFGLDFGFANPMAAVIVGYDYDGRAYILEEYYERGVQIENVIAWLTEKMHTYPGLKGYADPSEPQFIMKMIQSGIRVQAANHAVLPGINSVYDALSIREDGKARLYVLEECPTVIEEFTQYRYKDKKEGTPQKEEPVKVDDHLMDAIRYVIKTHRYGSTGYQLLQDPKGLVF
jgi:PBSX family phage terminase large subunit